MSFEIRDAIYGDIVLSEDEASLLDTYEMQRLRHIKQLGNVNLVYPSANHTRFEHSLGTRWLAQKIVRISNLPLESRDRRILYKSALLHDIAEASYVHVTERLKAIGLPLHEEVIEYVLDGTYKEKVLERKETDAKFVCDTLTDDEKERIRLILIGHPKMYSDKPFLHELVHGYIDADTLDYLRRDSLFLGLPYGNYDDRIFATFRIAKHDNNDHIAFRDSNDSINAIISILNSRYTLRKAAYLHHSVILADEMFLRALRMALSDRTVDEFDIFILGDYELLSKIRQSPSARRLVDMLLSRNLFKRTYVIGSQAPARIRDIVDALEKDITEQADFTSKISYESKISQDGLLLSFSPPSGWKDFNHILLVSEDDGRVVTLGNRLPEELSLLERKYRYLWRFMISVDSKDYELREKLSEVCSDHFNYASDFRPKKSFDEVKRLREEIWPFIENLREREPSSINVLRVLLQKSKPMTRDEVARELDLKPATVSHYLTLINQHLQNAGVEVLSYKRMGRLKFWRINERVNRVINDV